MHGGELGAVGHLGVAGGAQVTDVVEQRDDDTEHGALRAEALRFGHLHLVADDQPRGGQRDVERVLLIVVDGVDAVVPGHAAREHAFEIAEHVGEGGELVARPDLGEQLFDGGANIGSRTHEDRVGDVVVAATGVGDHSAIALKTNKMGESRQGVSQKTSGRNLDAGRA